MTQRLNYQRIAGAGMRALNGVHAYIGQCGLPKALVDLVYLRVSQINGCAYCVDMHSRDLISEGVSTEKLMLLVVWREAGDAFTEQERAALAWAETVTRVAETSVPDDEYQLASSVFSEQDLVNLTIAIGLMNAFNRLAISFRAGPSKTSKVGH